MRSRAGGWCVDVGHALSALSDLPARSRLAAFGAIRRRPPASARPANSLTCQQQVAEGEGCVNEGVTPREDWLACAKLISLSELVQFQQPTASGFVSGAGDSQEPSPDH